MIHVKGNLVDGILPDTKIRAEAIERLRGNPLDLYRHLYAPNLPRFFTALDIHGFRYYAPILIEWFDGPEDQ